ncbi:hypothetical protein QL285_066003 [Trifolium repens]|nr:hypothetical protein QL285_066003 [Trifolium repens]
MSLPWLTIGDFNDILLPSEQKGGVFSTSKADIFASNVDKCGLIDLSSFGTKFTWQGHCRGSRIVHRRLDRSFCNYDWRMKFPEATVEHLVRRNSDHNPILLRCSNVMMAQEDRPFRFQAAWFTHNDYPNLVRNTWNRNGGNIVHCLHNVATESTTFNKEVFGNIFARKKEVEARLRGIQRALEDIDSANLLRLQKELLQEYDNILFQEETLWYRKSREKLIKLGSRNTSFFHAQSIIRRKRNKIHGIKLNSGEWCTDPDIMKAEALMFFKELFCTNQQVTIDNHADNGVTLTEDAVSELAKPVTKKEVYDALMSMKSYKAPGPDGFQPIFFKLFWQDIGDDIWWFVNTAFANGTYDKKICETLVVLLPKGDTQTSFKDFRPISLCNVTYKLLSKIIVSRLRPFLDGIVSPLQNSFIPGRSTKDNAIVLQEVVHFLNKSKKKNGDMVFKLDLEKAYDRVNWSFLRDTLEKFQFPTRIISLIMFGITSSSNSILWNGSKTEAFTPKRGLRQGDPLSPYLFVLCMERLGEMISRSVNNGAWKPIQITKDGTKLSHLFFADDVLLFAKATVAQARVVKDVLEHFCALSGLKISLAKSKFCTSIGVCRRIRDNIATTTQIHATDRFEKYLGFKLFYGKVRKQDFSEIYDRVSAKLASWKGRLLNKPGRVVLANSVISSLPSYHMQVHWLLQGMCDDLDRTVRRFIWKGTGDSGMHLVGWDKVTQPRRYGGLGVRIARGHNVSLLGKLIWEILTSPSKLWVRLFTEKYLKGRNIFNASVTGGSFVWNSVVKTLRLLKDGFSFKIGDGNTNFWFEPWLLKERLSTTVPFVAIQDTNMKVKDVWQNNSWHLENLYTNVPEDVRSTILALKPHVVNGLPDVWIWNTASTGIYSPKGAYEWLLKPSPNHNHSNWKWIWQLQLPASIQFFVWQCLHNSIPTKDVLHRRRVVNSNMCPRCSTAAETIFHCLFYCTEAACIWKVFGLLNNIPISTEEELFGWCRKILLSHGKTSFVIMWVIWCARNDVIFNNKRTRVQESVTKIQSLLSDCAAAFGTEGAASSHSTSERLVTWSRPREGTVCLNVDGSLLGTAQTAGFGGLIRDTAGTFIKGFYGSAAHASVLFAEIIAVLQGLQLCWENGFKHIVCFSDSLQAVTLIKTGVSPHHRFANEIHSIRLLLSRDWNVEINHTLREGNACADCLAKRGSASDSPLVILDTPPVDMHLALLADAQGVIFSRE